MTSIGDVLARHVPPTVQGAGAESIGPAPSRRLDQAKVFIRTHATDALIATAIGMFITVESWHAIQFGIGSVAVGIAVLTGRRRISRQALYAALVLAISGTVAVLTTPNAWVGAAWQAVWLWIMVGVLVAKTTPLIWAWFTPYLYVIAGSVFADGLVNGGPRYEGLVNNPNNAAGLMALGATYLLTTKYKWLAIPLLAALPLTGSRLAVATVVAVLIAQLVLRKVPAKQWAAIVLVSAICAAPWWGESRAGLRLPEIGQRESITAAVGTFNAVGQVTAKGAIDAGKRIALRPEPAQEIGWRPYGPSGGDSSHNTVVRIAIEAGIIAAIAWIFLTLRGAWLSRKAAMLPVLLVLLMLSTLDIYLWVPPTLSSIWWTAMGMAHEK